jgi:hypothetical protein
LDKFISSGVFVIGIPANSKACGAASTITDGYKAALEKELAAIGARLAKSGLTKKIRIALYVPLADKNGFVTSFDSKLKGLQ